MTTELKFRVATAMVLVAGLLPTPTVTAQSAASQVQTSSSPTTTLLMNARQFPRLGQPRHWQTVTGVTTVSGWMAFLLGKDAISSTHVELVVDQTAPIPLTVGVQRPDVQKEIRPMGFNVPPNLGFTGTWDTTGVPNGFHELVVRAVVNHGKYGKTAEIARITVRVANP